ncbi:MULTISPECIES: hypothetical protein [unclassified Paenibacillus]|uniref:hypothetical protein n=1 Tax=unclassified Paenibacillus TaxID=185978 RepID=UPI002405227D|nr:MULTISPECIES: hypothetical protein [unclassified Paenibacillus]MDF9841620.1 hypothetical protein [Paenibacillus sp. PastF-2]MDF9848268.1 hypothetical protein [Paenibacillus sp. PastM-2]MDF9854779.1 hypothetical protein [Paenibacillus sp. PastF-1]MDH6480049.1 hypothetical protein [Paenibacillus sp. PastH-2]MDH6507482.1 hypothetical protein [Paenibacillus sp. PastM-3]
MKPEQLNEWFDSITPTGLQKESMLRHILKAGNSELAARPVRHNGAKVLRVVSIIAAVVLILAGGSLARSLTGKSSFTVIAYADGIEDATIASGNMVLITGDSSIELPFGAIGRDSGPIETTDEDGNKVISYNTNYTNLSPGNGTFSLQGENILSVTYTSEKGLLTYTDYELMMQDKNYIKAQQAAAEKNQKLVLTDLLNAPYYQSGQTVTPKYYPELGDRSFAVDWAPFYATKMLSEDGDVSPANLPHDRITIKVTLKNKEQVVKIMDLSFAADGSVVAKMIK